MTTISIDNKYVEVLKTFGDLQQGVDLALRRYAIEQITTKVTELRQKDAFYQAKYGLDYPIFSQRIAKDEVFINHIETQVNKMWEIDLADWEFCYKGIKDWTQKLQTILLG